MRFRLWEQEASTVQMQTAGSSASSASFDLSGLVAFVLVALVVVMVGQSIRTRSDTRLALLLGAISLAYAADIVWTGALVADPTDYLRIHPWASLSVAFSLETGLFLFTLSGLATIIVTVCNRHWAWLAANAALLPLIVLALVGGVPTDSLSYAANIVPLAVTLFCPILVGMAFALSRRPGEDSAG